MKALRFFANLLMFLAICVGLSITQLALFDLAAAQSSDVDPIHVASGADDEIGYFDSYAFPFDDMSNGFKAGAKYRVRNWIPTNWWKKGMKWADVALDFSIAVVKPIVVPVAQVNAIMDYYGRSINEYNEQLLEYYKSERNLNDAYYQLYVIYNMGYGDCYTVGENSVKIQDYNYEGVVPEEDADMACEYARWVRNNKKLYNYNWKLCKYNNGAYDKYFTKFIMVSDTGERHIKQAVVAMYYQQYVSIAVALIFIVKFPINFIVGAYEGSDIRRRKKHIKVKKEKD